MEETTGLARKVWAHSASWTQVPIDIRQGVDERSACHARFSQGSGIQAYPMYVYMIGLTRQSCSAIVLLTFTVVIEGNPGSILSSEDKVFHKQRVCIHLHTKFWMVVHPGI